MIFFLAEGRTAQATSSNLADASMQPCMERAVHLEQMFHCVRQRHYLASATLIGNAETPFTNRIGC